MEMLFLFFAILFFYVLIIISLFRLFLFLYRNLIFLWFYSRKVFKVYLSFGPRSCSVM